MKKRLLLTAMSATLSLGFLGACGMGNNNLDNPDDVNFRPVRYERQDNGVFDNNRGDRNGVDRLRQDTNTNLERGNRGNDGFFDINNDNNNNNGNNGGLFNRDNNNNMNTDLFDNDRDRNNGVTGTNQGNGTMRGRTTGQ